MTLTEGHTPYRGKVPYALDRAEDFLRDKSLLLLGVVAGAALLVGFALRGGRRAARS